MELSQLSGWIGTALGMLIGIPQLVKTIKTKKTGDLSEMTFILIMMTSACLLVRAIAIKELAFIFYYIFLILINSLQVFLIWRYKDRGATT